MTPQQQALIQKAARSIQSAIGQNETGFPEFAASERLLRYVLHCLSVSRR